MCLKRVEKKKLLGRQNKVAKLLLKKHRSSHRRCSEKLCNIHRMKVARGKCSVKKGVKCSIKCQMFYLNLSKTATLSSITAGKVYFYRTY